MVEQGWKDTVAINSEEPNKIRFKYELERNLMAILDSLLSKNFRPSPLRKKKILYPKERIAQVPSIRDKIVQHVICDNYLNDRLSKPLIKETGACLKNRGVHYSSKIVKEQLHNYYVKYGNGFYVLKCDIKSYFSSIQHDRIYNLLDRYVEDQDVSNISKSFINLMNIGLALGLQQSQILANLNLSELDHLCKEKLGIKCYGRYMDDFYIISNEISDIEIYYNFIKEYIESIGLILNPKTKVYKDRFDFLGFSFTLTPTGKIIKTLSNDKKHSKIRHIRKMLNDIQNNKLSIKDFANSYQGWRIHALNGNCYNLIKSIDGYIQNELNDMGYAMFLKKSKKKERVFIQCLE